MKKFSKRLAIGAMAAVLAISAVSAQVSAADLSTMAPQTSMISQDLMESIEYHSMGDVMENNVQVGNSPVKINAFSGNVYFQLADLPITLSYNSMRNTNVGYGPNFISDSHQTLIRRGPGNYLYTDATGNVSHFSEVEGFEDLKNEKGLWVYESSSPYVYLDMNTRPKWMFGYDGRFMYASSRDQQDVYHTHTTVNYNADDSVASTKYSWYEVAYDYYPAAEGEIPMVKSIIRDGKTTYTLIYNDQNNLLRVENEAGKTLIDLEYDETGRLVTRIGGTFITYDETGKAVSVKTYKDTGFVEEELTFEYGNGSTVITKLDGTSQIIRFNADGSRIY